ncbi:MAG: aldo/keto reductase [Bacteroidales bacterium]
MSSESPKKNRRQFLSQTSFALASAGVVGLVRPWSAAQQKPPVPVKGKAVIQRTLGRTGIKLPIVSMGVMNANNPELLKQAYEAGIRLFDTALGYQQGRNERMIGDVVSQMGIRDKVIIETKIPFPRVPAGEVKAKFLADFAGCLERLQTKYVDILMIHQPSVEQMNNPEAVAALKELKDQKTARFIGVSQHGNQAATLNAAAEGGIYDVVLVGFNVLNAADADFLAALKTASAKGVGIIAMKTQTGGRARNLGALNQTAMLKWALQHPEIATAIPGFTNSDQLAESYSVASGLEFTAEEKTWLADKNVKLALDFCKQCGTCLPTCPRGVDIPTLMRTHMYAANYANFEHARATFEEIPRHASLVNCTSCSTCSAQCANNVRIGDRVADLKAMYA